MMRTRRIEGKVKKGIDEWMNGEWDVVGDTSLAIPKGGLSVASDAAIYIHASPLRAFLLRAV